MTYRPRVTDRQVVITIVIVTLKHSATYFVTQQPTEYNWTDFEKKLQGSCLIVSPEISLHEGFCCG